MEFVAGCCACVQHAACDPTRGRRRCLRPYREAIVPIDPSGPWGVVNALAVAVTGWPRTVTGGCAVRARGRCRRAVGRPCGAPRPGGDAAVGRWVARALLRRWEAAASTRPRRGAWVQLGLLGVVL